MGRRVAFNTHTPLLVFLACLGKSISVLMIFFYISLQKSSITHYITKKSCIYRRPSSKVFLMSVSSLFSSINDFQSSNFVSLICTPVIMPWIHKLVTLKHSVSQKREGFLWPIPCFFPYSNLKIASESTKIIFFSLPNHTLHHQNSLECERNPKGL